MASITEPASLLKELDDKRNRSIDTLYNRLLQALNSEDDIKINSELLRQIEDTIIDTQHNISVIFPDSKCDKGFHTTIDMINKTSNVNVIGSEIVNELNKQCNFKPIEKQASDLNSFFKKRHGNIGAFNRELIRLWIVAKRLQQLQQLPPNEEYVRIFAADLLTLAANLADYQIKWNYKRIGNMDKGPQLFDSCNESIEKSRCLIIARVLKKFPLLTRGTDKERDNVEAVVAKSVFKVMEVKEIIKLSIPEIAQKIFELIERRRECKVRHYHRKVYPSSEDHDDNTSSHNKRHKPRRSAFTRRERTPAEEFRRRLQEKSRRPSPSSLQSVSSGASLHQPTPRQWETIILYEGNDDEVMKGHYADGPHAFQPFRSGGVKQL